MDNRKDIVSTVVGRLKYFLEALVMIDTKMGFKKVLKYVCLVLVVVSLFNFKTVSTYIFSVVQMISNEVHSEKMRHRDEYMLEISPLLTEFMGRMDADRIMYFEFHNSESGLDGLPFKFFDLMKSSSRYGVHEILGSYYKDIGAAMYPEFFNKLKQGDVLICQGDRDIAFRRAYPGVYELFNTTDGSKRFIVFGVPGLKQPIGFIVLEWIDDNGKDLVVSSKKINNFLPRISALSYRRGK